MKRYDDQLLKMIITKDKLKMEISLKDLVFLFESSPENTYDGESVAVKVKRGKKQEFAEFIARNFMEESEFGNNGDYPIWGVPFEEVFMKIIEGNEDDFCKYNDEWTKQNFCKWMRWLYPVTQTLDEIKLKKQKEKRQKSVISIINKHLQGELLDDSKIHLKVISYFIYEDLLKGNLLKSL